VAPAAGADAPDTLDAAARLFNQYAPHVGRRDRKSLVRLDFNYPDERRLDRDNVEANTRKINAITSPRAITAAGGICGPLDADFSHPVCGDRGRPIKNGLVSFRADRGGVRYIPALSIDPAAPGVTVWTSENDANPTDPAVKACPPVDCEEELTCEVDAVVACLTIGNFQARFSPEQWQAALQKVMIEHDRVAEQKMLAEIDAASTAVTYGGGSGTATDVLAALLRASAGIRSRLRQEGGNLVAVLPEWVREAIISDVVHKNTSGSVIENYNLAAAQVASFFTSKQIRPIWSPDADVFGAQGAGALLDFPGADAVIRLFPEGSFLALDGGTLDLGTEIHDSGLNATNDRQAFMETFEKVCFRGCESLAITVPIDDVCGCPTDEPA
jgi:hypothetical protein